MRIKTTVTSGKGASWSPASTTVPSTWHKPGEHAPSNALANSKQADRTASWRADRNFKRPVRSKSAHHLLRVTGLMLSPSLGAAWFAWQIGPPVGFCAEPHKPPTLPRARRILQKPKSSNEVTLSLHRLLDSRDIHLRARAFAERHRGWS